MAKYKNFAELKINDFRAIKSADINLNGITVVSGINGCGKTTISKLIYNIYSTIINFDELAKNIESVELLEHKKLLNQIQLYCTLQPKDIISVSDTKKTIQKVRALLSKYKEQNISAEKVTIVLQNILKNNSEDLDYLFEMFINEIVCKIDDINRQIKNRDYKLFKSKIEYLYSNDLFSQVKFAEYKEDFINNNLIQAPMPFAVNKVIYNDSPICVGRPYEIDEDYFDNLTDMLEETVVNNNYANPQKIELINKLIKGENILNGNSFYDEEQDQYFYETHGNHFELKDCATGIKSFSLIQILLNNGHLTENTLLIIDEPEAHLHPQWIVEYAKLIVMLHKELGVKFFLASHNPDFVQSIRYISEKDGVLDSVNFYVAEKENDSDVQYSFKECKDDIEPLFESFNKSFSKFDEYVYPEIFK